MVKVYSSVFIDNFGEQYDGFVKIDFQFEKKNRQKRDCGT